MRKVLIWGCAASYNKLLPLLRLHDLKIQAIISKMDECFEYLDSCKIIKPENILEYEFEYIIVASNSFNEIRRYVATSVCLKQEGCTEEKLIPYYVFFNFGFDFEKYIRFKESRPSILSNFCIGGHLYRQWGLPFLSPTVNMYSLGAFL